jgi:hypothetical protein
MNGISLAYAYAKNIPGFLIVLLHYIEHCKNKNESAIMTQNWHVPIIIKAGYTF